MKEPKQNLTGFYIYKYKEQVYTIAHVGWKRKQRVYAVAWPRMALKAQSWEDCIEQCQLHYLENHKKPKRKRK